MTCLLWLCSVLMIVPVPQLEACRTASDTAVTETDRVAADLRLLDVLLGEAWAHHLAVDSSLLGLPDERQQTLAIEFLSEAMMVSERLDRTLQHMAAAGQHVTLDSARWKMRRGVACAAYGVLADDLVALREAAALLADVLANGGDATGRVRRLLILVHRSLGDHDQATRLLSAEQPIMDPVEQVAMQILAWEPSHAHDWSATVVRQLAQAEASWQMQLLAEAGLAQAHTAAQASAIAQAWIDSWPRNGGGAAPVEQIIRATAARMPTQAWKISDTTSPYLVAGWIDALVASDQVGRGLSMADSAHMDARRDRDQVVLLDARASARSAAGDATGAVQDWLQASRLGGGQQSAAMLDQAARLAIRTPAMDPVLVDRALRQAAMGGASAGYWTLALAHREAAKGHHANALQMSAQVLPDSPAYVDALKLSLHLLTQALRSEQLLKTDETVLDDLRAQALIAHRRGRLGAAEVAVGAAMLRIEQQLLHGDINRAQVLRSEDEVLLLGDPASIALIDAKLMAMASGGAALDRHVASLGAAEARALLVWLASHRPDQCASVAASIGKLDASGEVTEDLLLADTLRDLGRGADALAMYNAVLEVHPQLTAAILGRCECLWPSQDREVLAALARDYRRVASLPRLEDVDRWRLANERLLSVLLRAGAPAQQIAAKCARLQLIDSEIQCPIQNEE